jgi:DNA repair exonuclease SbcCD nuclease subunit
MKFIFTADLHLREDRPLCRTDIDWLQTQEDQLDFIAKQANKAGVPVVIAGDIFHRSQAPNSIISTFFRFAAKVNQMVYVIAGNHEIKWKTWDYIRESSFGIIDEVIKNKGVNIAYPDELGQYMNFNTEIKG